MFHRPYLWWLLGAGVIAVLIVVAAAAQSPPPPFFVQSIPPGLGREGVRFAIQELTEPKVLAKNRAGG